MPIGEALASESFNDFIESLAVISATRIESKCLLVEVSEQVERFDAYIRAIDAALEKTPEVFDPVRVDLAVNVFLSMVDHVVNIVVLHSIVRAKRIAIDSRSRFDMLRYFCVQGLAAHVRHNARSHFAVALKQSHHSNFARSARTVNPTSTNRAVHVTRFATDESFVYFDVTGHLLHKRSGLHGKSDAVVHEPRGFLSDAKRTRNFVAADSVFTIHDQPYGSQPLIQTKRRILKDGANLNGELSLLVGALALPFVLLRQKGYVFAPACRTLNAIGPSASSKVFATVIRIREVNDCLLKRLRVVFVRHDVRILA